MINNLKETNGFSLIELIIASGISVIMAAFIFNLFIGQNKSYRAQDQVTEMQQNMRAAFNLMVKEIRMAGYDPTQNAGAGIGAAGSNSIRFTMDIYEDGNCTDSDEDITYSLYTEEGIRKLGKSTLTTANQPIAEHIEAMGFAYALDTNNDSILETDGPHIIWAINKSGTWYDLDTNNDGNINTEDNVVGGENTGISVNEDDIRAVRIWLLIRTTKGEKGYINDKTYIVGNQSITPLTDADANNDNMRMRHLETIVRLRNMI